MVGSEVKFGWSRDQTRQAREGGKSSGRLEVGREMASPRGRGEGEDFSGRR